MEDMVTVLLVVTLVLLEGINKEVCMDLRLFQHVNVMID